MADYTDYDAAARFWGEVARTKAMALDTVTALLSPQVAKMRSQVRELQARISRLEAPVEPNMAQALEIARRERIDREDAAQRAAQAAADAAFWARIDRRYIADHAFGAPMSWEDS